MYLVLCLVSKDIKEKTHLKACTFFLADMALCISLNTPTIPTILPGIQWCVQGFVVDIA